VTDGEAQTATLRFDGAVKGGRHQLAFDYRGKIQTTPAGLFAVDYDTPAGPRRMLATQFEVGDARRVAPMWDEPSAKATLLEVPSLIGVRALNMPVAIGADGEKERVRFEEPGRCPLLLSSPWGIERICDHRRAPSAS
jgi:aminopeptidase N